jgi:hypothetical protein
MTRQRRNLVVNPTKEKRQKINMRRETKDVPEEET